MQKCLYSFKSERKECMRSLEKNTFNKFKNQNMSNAKE